MIWQPFRRRHLEHLGIEGLGRQVTGLRAPAVGAVEGFLRAGRVEGEAGDRGERPGDGGERLGDWGSGIGDGGLRTVHDQERL